MYYANTMGILISTCATRLHILQYIAVCFLDEAINSQTHMMIMDYALCVCFSMSFAERNFGGKIMLAIAREFYVIVYMVANAMCPV